MPKLAAIGCATAALAAICTAPASAATVQPRMPQSCPSDYGYDFSGTHNYYKDMEPRSGGDSGTTISIILHKGKTTTSTVGGSIEGEAKIVFVKAKAQVDYHFAWSWTNDATYQWSWTVPSSMRHGYLHAGSLHKSMHWEYNHTEPNCTTRVVRSGSASMVYPGRETWHGAS